MRRVEKKQDQAPKLMRRVEKKTASAHNEFNHADSLSSASRRVFVETLQAGTPASPPIIGTFESSDCSEDSLAGELVLPAGIDFQGKDVADPPSYPCLAATSKIRRKDKNTWLENPASIMIDCDGGDARIVVFKSNSSIDTACSEPLGKSRIVGKDAAAALAGGECVQATDPSGEITYMKFKSFEGRAMPTCFYQPFGSGIAWKVVPALLFCVVAIAMAMCCTIPSGGSATPQQQVGEVMKHSSPSTEPLVVVSEDAAAKAPQSPVPSDSTEAAPSPAPAPSTAPAHPAPQSPIEEAEPPSAPALAPSVTESSESSDLAAGAPQNAAGPKKPRKSHFGRYSMAAMPSQTSASSASEHGLVQAPSASSTLATEPAQAVPPE